MESERKGQRKIWGKREIRGEVRGNKEIKRERERREREGERGREREREGEGVVERSVTFAKDGDGSERSEKSVTMI